MMLFTLLAGVACQAPSVDKSADSRGSTSRMDDSEVEDSSADTTDLRGPGPWKYVTTGIRRSCGIPVDGPVDCWGEGPDFDSYYPDYGIGDPPDLPFAAIDINFGFREYVACGVLEDTSIACWGTSDVVANTPEGTYVSVSTGERGAAALSTDRHVVSWGGQYAYAFEGDDYLSAAAWFSGACGARESGIVDCGYGYVRPATFVKIATDMSSGLCGLDTSGRPECGAIRGVEYDDILGPLLDVPSETFVDLCTGSEHACGRTAEGDIVCWGEGGSDRLEVPPDVYVQMDCGQEQTCAVNTAGEITCWGECAHGEC